jgi:hypothetical protein
VIEPVGVSGSVSLTAASGADPVSPIFDPNENLNVSKSGVLLPGTYTLNQQSEASDDNAAIPDQVYGLDLEFD